MSDGSSKQVSDCQIATSSSYQHSKYITLYKLPTMIELFVSVRYAYLF